METLEKKRQELLNLISIIDDVAVIAELVLIVKEYKEGEEQ